MGDEFIITSEILDNPKFLSCSMLAGRLYMAMILRADHEGRALADPLTWTSKASCWGPAAATPDEVQAALDELDRARLAPQYEVKGKRFLFLPGRFEHNTGKKYWKASKTPLPPLELLEEFPEYLTGLQKLTTKGLVRTDLPNDQNWRYPMLKSSTETAGFAGIKGESGGKKAEFGNDVGLGLEVGTPKGVRREERARVVDQSVPESTQATQSQIDYAESVLRAHDLDLAAWQKSNSVDAVTSKHINQILDQYKDPPSKEQRGRQATQARNASLRLLKDELDEVHQRDGPNAVRVWIREQDKVFHGALWERYKKLEPEAMEATR